MQRILSWIGSRLFSEQAPPPVRGSAGARPLQRAIRPPAQKPVASEPEVVEVKKSQLVELRPEVSGRIESIGPGKNVLVQNKYLQEDAGKDESLKIVDDALLDSDDAGGFDPYNTGKFDRAANWARTRK